MNIFSNYLSAFSVENISQSFKNVLARFPITVLASFIGTCILLYMNHLSLDDERYIKLFCTTLLAVPLFYSIEIFNEQKLANKWLIIGFGCLLLVSFWYFIPIENQFGEKRKFQISIAVLLVVMHLLASIAPYLSEIFKKNRHNYNATIIEFWNYNKSLFLSILNALLYSVSLAVGLNLAILAIEKLFEININGHWYRHIIIVSIGFLNTIFFLGKVPKTDVIASNSTEYPIGLKYFTQYVLLPLVAIYVLILLAYEFKIIAQWSLPKGWVSVLVMASAIFGILAFLLLYPLRNGNKWVANFTKLYYWVLLPLIGLMLVAIFVRIKEYGVTEPRYFIAIISIWLLCISLYFSISKVDNIKIIPVSLIIIGLWSVFGPFNAFFASRFNQENRLQNVFVSNNILVNGKIAINKNLKLTDADARKLNSAVDYLAENNLVTLKKYLSNNVFEIIRKEATYNRENKFYSLTGIRNANLKFEQPFNFNRKGTEVEKLYAADYALFLGNYTAYKYDIVGSELILTEQKNFSTNQYSIKIDGETILFDLGPILNNKETELSAENMTSLASSRKWELRLVFDNISVQKNNLVESFSGRLYFKRK